MAMTLGFLLMRSLHIGGLLADIFIRYNKFKGNLRVSFLAKLGQVLLGKYEDVILHTMEGHTHLHLAASAVSARCIPPATLGLVTAAGRQQQNAHTEKPKNERFSCLFHHYISL